MLIQYFLSLWRLLKQVRPKTVKSYYIYCSRVMLSTCYFIDEHRHVVKYHPLWRWPVESLATFDFWLFKLFHLLHKQDPLLRSCIIFREENIYKTTWVLATVQTINLKERKWKKMGKDIWSFLLPVKIRSVTATLE